MIQAAPNAEWRLLIALSRWGGLRVPSEALALEWRHIDWAGGTFTVPCSKTARTGKPYRVVPIFGELLPYLEDAQAVAEGSRYVISRYRDSSTNLRSRLMWIIRKAGLEPWERLWHNLRASRASELASEYPANTAADWLGHTPAVADRHYLQTLGEHVAHAQRRPQVEPGVEPSGPKVEQKVEPQPTEANGNGTPLVPQSQGFGVPITLQPEEFATAQVPPRGVEPLFSD